MPNYQDAKIYTIRCRTDDTLIYVGSTTQPLYKRWGGHKVISRNEKCKNILIYTKINNDWDNWYIELYETCPCNSSEELRRREGQVIRLIGTLNSRIAGRTMKEYYQNHRQELVEKMKEYNKNHKQEIANYQKEYQQNHKQEIAEYQREYRKNHKQEQK